jgi:hypothetical protein
MNPNETTPQVIASVPLAPSRRTFLAAAAGVAGLTTLGTENGAAQEIEPQELPGSAGGRKRQRQAYRVRVAARKGTPLR